MNEVEVDIMGQKVMIRIGEINGPGLAKECMKGSLMSLLRDTSSNALRAEKMRKDFGPIKIEVPE